MLKWINMVASIATIFALIWGFVVFKAQIDRQENAELNSHISNMLSLKKEIEKNIELAILINDNKESVEDKIMGKNFIT